MKLTFQNLHESQRPNEGLATMVFALVVSIGAITLTSYLGKSKNQRYGIYIKDFKEPNDTLYKMPGVYIKKEDEKHDGKPE